MKWSCEIGDGVKYVNGGVGVGRGGNGVGYRRREKRGCRGHSVLVFRATVLGRGGCESMLE